MEAKTPVHPKQTRCPDIFLRLIRDLEEKKIAYVCYDVIGTGNRVTRVLKILDRDPCAPDQ